MSEFYEIISKVAGVIALAGFIPYIISILQGKTKPNRVTWWIWTVIGALLCASYWSSGGVEAIWVPISYVIGPLSIALLSLKYGYGTLDKFDRSCLLAAVISLLFWWISGSALIALLMNITIDMFGAMPTIKKTYHEPESESQMAWGFFLVGNTLNLIALSNWEISQSLYPIYLFSISIIVYALTMRKKRPVAQRRTNYE
ncbi:hypothetical protein GCM10009133_10890 [Cocleimonas flava]|uniref:PQ loop repeat protein n=1 Tax=Cocleimonas flava TaxID=634765 RepID=A0A4R1F223_9GAMM|nr:MULTISPECIES: hypothetical protein [Cocleimonas]MEB8434416.1 hypothetical protein [Cocleimonas sp. KMM 6892]MEC4717309.1 hypothetical protein [Cocleimonas sp. KMM 6895]MEC4746688.1 hypothetical protein [Cocleimonas sp. KMM 6896]TCJ87450.1 hypothetical protein EV695_1960 [Cocleimonas flava]